MCSTPKRCNSNGAISTFDIRAGELRATFLRNHNMRRHKDPSRRHPKPGRQPKRKTTQAEDNSSTEDPRNPDSRHNRHKHGGTAPVTWRCTRYVAVHPNRRGALPTDRVQRPNKQEQTRNWHTEPLTTTPLHAHLGPTGGRMGTPPTPPPALRPTPAHSDTSYTLKCEEPVFPAPLPCLQFLILRLLLPCLRDPHPPSRSRAAAQDAPCSCSSSSPRR